MYAGGGTQWNHVIRTTGATPVKTTGLPNGSPKGWGNVTGLAQKAWEKGPSADAIQAKNARLEEARYQEIYRPLNLQLMDELKENRLMQAANESVAEYSGDFDSTKQQARLDRQMGRQGLTVDDATRTRIDRARKFGNAENTVFTLDHARMGQRDYNDMLRTELINTGRGIATSASDMLSTAANMEASRNQANAAAKAQDRAAKMQLAGSLGGMALMAAFMM